MSPQDYIDHAREVLGFSEEKIQKNRYAIESGRFYTLTNAHTENAERQAKEIAKASRTDAEVSEAKAKHGKAYTTQYATEWAKSQGWVIAARESYDHRLKRKRDIFGGWDILAVDRNGHNILIQAFGPGEHQAHLRKMQANRAIERAQTIKARMLMLEFERGDKTPKVHEIKDVAA